MPNACSRRRRRCSTAWLNDQPITQPITRPPVTAHSRSTAHQRHAPLPRSCSPSTPNASITNGKAVPSFKPPSPLRLKRSRSRSPGLSTCTSDASTGSVGASTAASSSAAPSDRPSPKPTAVRAPMVSTIASDASSTGASHSRSVSRTRSRRPTANSEINTAASVSTSSKRASANRSRCSSPDTCGPINQPASRYNAADENGRPRRIVSVRPMPISSRPITRHQRVSIAPP